jgi:outer membrane protein
MLTSRLIAAAAALGLTAGCACAADIMGGSADSYKDTPGNYWVITLGGYAGAMPDYQGSKGYAGTFRPAFDIHQAGQMEWITLPTDAFGLTLYNTANFRIGAAGDWLQNRNSKDDSTLNGLHSINYTVELGAFAEYYPLQFLRTRAEVLQGVSGADGLTVNLMADYIYRPNQSWLFTAGPRLQFANTQYESTFYSINASEAAASGLTPYHASGGLNSAGANATARYYFNDRFSVRGFVEWDRLVDDAANSTLVKAKGSEDQVQFGLGAAYRFNYAW